MRPDDPRLTLITTLFFLFILLGGPSYAWELGTNIVGGIKTRRSTPKYYPPIESVKPKPRVVIRRGYVYLLRSSDGIYKIGQTHDPDNRLRTFKVHLPFDVEYEYLIPCDDRFKLESRLHKHFAALRIRGEWFNLSPDDVAYIKMKFPVDVGKDQIQ